MEGSSCPTYSSSPYTGPLSARSGQSVLYSQLMLRCGLAELPVGTAWAPPEAIGTSIAAPNSSVATNVRRLPTIGWHLLARGADACPGGAAPVPGADPCTRWGQARVRPIPSA